MGFLAQDAAIYKKMASWVDEPDGWYPETRHVYCWDPTPVKIKDLRFHLRRVDNCSGKIPTWTPTSVKIFCQMFTNLFQPTLTFLQRGQGILLRFMCPMPTVSYPTFFGASNPVIVKRASRGSNDLHTKYFWEFIKRFHLVDTFWEKHQGTMDLDR